MAMFNLRVNNPISALAYLFFGALLISLFSCGGGGYVTEKEEEPIEEFIDDTSDTEAAPGCSDYSEAENTQFCTISSGGLTREFFIHLPEAYSDQIPPVPVLISLHGGGDYADANMAYSGFRDKADEHTFITIYPQGLLYEEKNSTGWDTGVDDIEFIEKVIDWTIDNFNAEPKEIYTAGFSNGAFMAYHIACNLSHKIAAIAPVAGLMGETTYQTCNSIHAMPIVHLHGVQDDVIYIDGGPEYLPLEDNGSTEGVVTYWKNINQCNEFKEQSIQQGQDTSIGTLGIWSNCRDGVEINYWKLDEVGHEWQSKGDGDDAVNVPSVIWEFLSRFTIDGAKIES